MVALGCLLFTNILVLPFNSSIVTKMSLDLARLPRMLVTHHVGLLGTCIGAENLHFPHVAGAMHGTQEVEVITL